MAVCLTEQQEMLRASARSFVDREALRHALVAAQRDGAALTARLWSKAAELGWPGILVPAEYGGSESTLTDAAVLFQELGRGPVPGPFFSSGVLGLLTVLQAATPAQRQALLPRVASGEAVLAVAIPEPHGSGGPPGIKLTPRRGGERVPARGRQRVLSEATHP